MSLEGIAGLRARFPASVGPGIPPPGVPMRLALGQGCLGVLWLHSDTSLKATQ